MLPITQKEIIYHIRSSIKGLPSHLDTLIIVRLGYPSLITTILVVIVLHLFYDKNILNTCLWKCKSKII